MTRRQAVATAARSAAVAALAGPADALGRPRDVPSVHCLPPRDRFHPVAVLGGCSFASFSPDGASIACDTPGGIEVRPRAGGPSRLVSPAGFSLGQSPWHPDGGTLLASGPGGTLAPPIAPFAVATDGSGVQRLLRDFPGSSRAACFSPDGRRVALTYLDRLLHRMVLADWAPGSPPDLVNPRVLLPFDPATEGDTGRMVRGLAWYETRGFSRDGRRLLFASDRGRGMANANAYTLDLESGRIRHVTRDAGFTEGHVAGPGEALFYGSTRARETSWMTVHSAIEQPPVLGFAAVPLLHDRLAARSLAPIGNGDVLVADLGTGLRARLVVKRETIARAAALGASQADHRIVVCSLSPDGRDLAVHASVRGSSAVVILRRDAVPGGEGTSATPVPPTAAPLVPPQRLERLLPPPLISIDRTLRGRYGGTLRVALSGDLLSSGSFEAVLDDFNDNGTVAYGGRMRFGLNGGAFSHSADVRRLKGTAGPDDDAEDEAGRPFYVADMGADDAGAGGTVSARIPRAGTVRGSAQNGVMRPEGRWPAGRRAARGVPGAERCRRS